MSRSRLLGAATLLAATAMSALLAAPPAFAAKPSITTVPSLPYTNSQTVTFPAHGGNANQSCASSFGAVTYQYTPSTDVTVTADTFGSSYDTVLSVYTKGKNGGELACNDDTSGLQSQVTVSLTAGKTYYFEVAQFGSASGTSSTGDLVFNEAVA